PSAVCSPTRYGILTGRYAWRSRLKKGVVRAYERALIDEGRATVASLFRDNGYQTAAIGKWHLGMNWQDANGAPTESAKQVDFSKKILHGPTARGFDFYYGDDIINWCPFRWIENDETLDLATHPHVNSQVLSTITAKSVEYIKAQAQTSEPFFLYMPLTAPHSPIAPMDGTAELQSVYSYDSLSDYEKFIANVDWSVGRVLKALDDQGIRDNTMIVFTSDNGVSKNFSTQDDVSPGFVAGELLRGQKADIWEGGHRMPFIVEWAGQIEAGSVSDEYVELNDFYATVAEIIGTEIDQHEAEDSYSLLSVLKGETLAGPLREAGVNHSITGKFAVRHIDGNGNEWKLIYGFGSGGFTKGKGPVIDPQAPITDLADFRLYNLTDDPNESDPFCLDRGNVTDEIRAKIFELDKILKRYISTGRSAPEHVELTPMLSQR
ncbi:MAG: arylsulfatase A, partial [Mariniblastus sp.]